MAETADKQYPLASYWRAYSQLEGLQEAYTLRYSLYGEPDGYRIEVCQSGPRRICTRCRMLGVTAGYARRVLQYLYENGVSAQQAADVIQDICGVMARG